MSYEDEIRSAQKQVEDYLATQGLAQEAQYGRSRDLIQARRAQTFGGVQAGLNKAVTDYGLSAAMGTAAPGEFRNVERQTLDPKLSAQLETQRMQARRSAITQTFNLAFDQFINAGMDVRTATERARAIALTLDQQKFQEGSAAQSRDWRTAESRLKQARSWQLAGANMISPQDSYQADVMNSLFNIGGSIISAAALKGKGTKGATFTPARGNMGATLTQQSGFTPYTQPGGYDTQTWADRFKAGGY